MFENPEAMPHMKDAGKMAGKSEPYRYEVAKQHFSRKEPTMELRIVNPDPEYKPVKLIEPTRLGYIHLAAEVSPLPIPPQRLPFVPGGRAKTELLGTLNALADRLEQLDTVEKATVFDAVAIPPTSRFSSYLKERADSIHPASFDVVVLIETASPEAARQVQQTPDYRALLDALESEAKDMHIIVGRNARRIGDVDKTRDGLFLFNYFVADDADVALKLWDYLAGWFEAETGLDNSTLLVPLENEESDYLAINHARWEVGLPRFLFRQLSKKSFRDYVLANMEANRVGAMPILYRLADPHRRADRPIDLQMLVTGLAVALGLGLVLRKVLKRLGR